MKLKILPPEHEDFGFYMLKIVKKRTGLKYDLWCDSLGKLRDSDILPYVMIRSDIEDGEWLVLDVLDGVIKTGNCIYFPEYEKVIAYVVKHKEAFLKHWNKDMDDLDLIQSLR